MESLRSLMTAGWCAARKYTGLLFLGRTVFHHMPTESSADAQYQCPHDSPAVETFKRIGEGQCGVVWAFEGMEYALKIPKEGKLNQLQNDSMNHQRAEEAFRQTINPLRKDIIIPKWRQWVHPTSTFWDKYTESLLADTSRTYGLVSSRIFPLPWHLCVAVVDAFAPRDVRMNKEAYLARDENKNCLVRLYLGRRENRPSTRKFHLRNFDLTVGEMEYFRLDTKLYARIMAQALAVLHWKAKLDANDVEYVLGSASKISTPPTAAELYSMRRGIGPYGIRDPGFHHRSVGMYLLDFDQCQNFPEDHRAVDQLMKGFYHNDPYYPRPCSTDESDRSLWRIFRRNYLEVSANLTDSRLPGDFIRAVEAEGQRRYDGRSMFQ